MIADDEASLVDTAAYFFSVSEKKREKLPHETITWDLINNESKRIKYLFIYLHVVT